MLQPRHNTLYNITHRLLIWFVIQIEQRDGKGELLNRLESIENRLICKHRCIHKQQSELVRRHECFQSLTKSGAVGRNKANGRLVGAEQVLVTHNGAKRNNIFMSTKGRK